MDEAFHVNGQKGVTMKFTKMHGLGNDYVYVNLFEEELDNRSEVAKKVSDRHFGIGSDGLILIAPSDVADCQMIMYNADGSMAEMCGNGVRCVAKYAYDHGIVTSDRREITVETGAGIKIIQLNVNENTHKVDTVKVDMLEPILEAEKIPVVADKSPVIDEPIIVGGKEWKMTCVSMGNPHCVCVVESTADFEIEKWGPLFENHERFPKRVNTEFIEIISRTEINMRVWERGTGETLACGTGTNAAVMACILNGLTEDKVLVHLLGGDLTIEYNRQNNHLYMTGPAEEVFTGEYEIK